MANNDIYNKENNSLHENYYMRPITQDDIDIALKNGWTQEEAQRGYVVGVYGDVCNSKALAIQKLDIENVFDSDLDAALQAEADGFCNLIHDLPKLDDVPKDSEFLFAFDLEVMENLIDTPENRETIYNFWKDEYNFEWSPMIESLQKDDIAIGS